MTRLRLRRCCLSFACGLLAAMTANVAAEQTYAGHTLDEAVTDERVYQVNTRVTVDGQVETSVGGGKAVAHPLEVKAQLGYRERRLPGTGRDAEALRSLRQYTDADAEIVISKQMTSARLRNSRRLIVAHGQPEGVAVHSPEGPLTFNELELLRVPGDSLSVLGLLPPKTVEIGESWDTSSWAIQTLTGTEAVLKSELKCKLESVDGGVAKVGFNGSIEGATAGASTDIEVNGHYLFDMNKGHWTHLELKQHEKRSVGAVAPGLDVDATVVANRSLSQQPGALTDAAVAKIPLEADESVMLLSFQTPWNIRFHHDRNWHVFHQSGQVAILRLLDKGSLIAQCNVSQIASVSAGKHTPEEQFQRDIYAALGDKIKNIEKAEQLQTDDGRYLYRVTVSGETNGLPMRWLYYLCADKSGRQVAFVFSIEEELVERLANRDLGIVNSLEFLDPVQPASAGR